MLAAILSLPILAVSCGNEDDASEPGLTFNTNPVPASASSYSQHITVSADKPWTIVLSYPGEQKDWASVSPESGNPENGDVRLTWSANLSEESRTATITVAAGGRQASFDFVQAGKGAAPLWLELPEVVRDETHEMFHHPMTVGGKKTRNYTFNWDYSNRVSNWVAYPMNKALVGSYFGRSDAWGFDPLLPDDRQSDVSTPYRRGNAGSYARGHQIASADRQGDRERNAATFYGTNMTPQDFDFNSGLWANLESTVRRWAEKSDTLYVITGCVPEGSSKYVLDASRRSVTVPKAYFKAVLRYKKSSTIGWSDYCGLGVYFDHDEHAGDTSSFTSDMSMSISELEELLGYRLFASLDAAVGAGTAQKIKSQDPRKVSWWW